MPARPGRGATRVFWLDAVKGIGIALIVLGHIWSIGEPSIYYEYIYSFHVPLFFFVAGLGFQSPALGFAQHIRRKATSLIVPYLWYASLGFAFYGVGYVVAQSLDVRVPQFDYGLWRPLVGILYGSVGDGHLVNSPVWFALALFWVLLVGHAVNKQVASDLSRVLVMLLLATLGVWLASSHTLAWSLLPALMSLAFFQAGVVYRARVGLASVPLAKAFAIFVFCALVWSASPLNGMATLAEGRIGHPVLFYLFAMAGTLMVVFLCQLLDRALPRAVRSLAWLGRYSLSIMLIHMLVVKGVKVILIATWGVSMQEIEHDLLMGLLVLMASSFLLAPTVFVMERYLGFTLGRFATPDAPARLEVKRD